MLGKVPESIQQCNLSLLCTLTKQWPQVSQHHSMRNLRFPSSPNLQQVKFCSKYHCIPLFFPKDKKISERSFQHICSSTVIVHRVDFTGRSAPPCPDLCPKIDALDIWWQKYPYFVLWNIHVQPGIPMSNTEEFSQPQGAAELPLKEKICPRLQSKDGCKALTETS